MDTPRMRERHAMLVAILIGALVALPGAARAQENSSDWGARVVTASFKS